MLPNSQSSSALACGSLTAERLPLTLFEIVTNVFEAENRRVQAIEAQRRLLQCRIQRDSQISGLQRNVEVLRRRLEELG